MVDWYNPDTPSCENTGQMLKYHKPDSPFLECVLFWQVSQKKAARSAEQAKHNISRHADPPHFVKTSVQQQQQQQQQQQPPQASSSQPSVQRSTADEERWRPQQAQHVQQTQDSSSSSLQKEKSGEGVGTAVVGRGARLVGEAAVTAAMASDTSAAHDRASTPPQVVHPSAATPHMPPPPPFSTYPPTGPPPSPPANMPHLPLRVGSSCRSAMQTPACTLLGPHQAITHAESAFHKVQATCRMFTVGIP